jgi:hypothetical protein
VEQHRNEWQRILSVMFYRDLGLCVELGDENFDNEVYGYSPTQDFITAVEKEIKLQTENTLDAHQKALRTVQERFCKARSKGTQKV